MMDFLGWFIATSLVVLTIGIHYETMRVVSDSVGLMSDSPLSFDVTVAFPLSGRGRLPQNDVFGAQYTARLYLCERFVPPVARRHASLEAKATG